MEEEKEKAQSFLAESEEGTFETDMKKQICDDPSYFPSNESTSRNFRSLEELARACDRFSVSNAAGAFIANAVLKDYGLLTEENIRQKEARTAKDKEPREGKKSRGKNPKRTTNHGCIHGWSQRCNSCLEGKKWAKKKTSSN